MLLEEQVRKTLGDELFEECISFFEEMYERRSEYKIMLTRRCFSLYKVFKPILEARNITNQYGTVITDNAIDFYIDDIKRALTDPPIEGAASVLVVDDIIIYGRTINTILTRLLDQISSDAIRVICLFQSSKSCISKKYESFVLPRYGVSSLKWKECSSIFSRLIKKADIANTSYIVSAFLNQDDINVQKFIENIKERMVCTTTLELRNYNVESYVIACTTEKGLCGLTKQLHGAVRVYIYNELKRVVISPLLILEKLTQKELENVVSTITSDYCNDIPEVCIFDMDNSCQMRFETLLLSHALLKDFFMQYDIKSEDIVDYDSVEIINYNFNPNLMFLFETFDKEIIENAAGKFRYNCDGMVPVSVELEQFMFKQAMLDNKSASLNTMRRNSGFDSINEESIFSQKYLAGLMTMIDNGIAALRTHFSVEEQGVSLSYPGEQAFRIISNRFQNLLPSMLALENMTFVYNKDSYKSYRDFCKYVNKQDANLLSDEDCKLFLEYVKILEDTNQQISDIIYIDDTEQNAEDCAVITQMLNNFTEEVVKK